MNNISFLIPESETIPTKLRLLYSKEDGKDITISYDRLPNELAYEFILYDITSKEEADEIIEEIAQKMVLQSYDHGQEWRIEGIEKIVCEVNCAIQRAQYIAHFRIKDTY